MKFRRIGDTYSVGTAAGFAVGTAQTLSLRIKQERRRLEGILLTLRTPGFASVTNPCAMYDFGVMSLLKEIRLRVNDQLGSRLAVQCKGPDLLEFNRQNGFGIDADTFEAIPTHISSVTTQMGVGASITNSVSVFVPLRHTLFQEPWGNLLSLPLSPEFLKEDPILEIDVGTLADTGSNYTANAGSYYLDAHLLYREVDPKVPYVPSELRTDSFKWPGTGKQQYEFPSSGFLTQVLVRNFDTSNLARGAIIAATEYWQVEYGREILNRFLERQMQALNQISLNGPVIGTNSTTGGAAIYRNSPGNNLQTYNFMLDFLTDFPGTDAFGVDSVMNLNPLALSGDKFRLVGNVTTAGYSRFTSHRILPASIGQLREYFTKGI